MSTSFLVADPVCCNPLPDLALPANNADMWSKKLAMALDATGRSRTYFAAVLDVHLNTLNNYLAGRTNPNPDILWQLCQLAGVSADWVLDDTKPARLVPATEPATGNVARVLASYDETEHEARLIRQSKRQDERAERPRRETGSKPGRSAAPPSGRGPDQGQLSPPATGKGKDKGTPPRKR